MNGRKKLEAAGWKISTPEEWGLDGSSVVWFFGTSPPEESDDYEDLTKHGFEVVPPEKAGRGGSATVWFFGQEEPNDGAEA